MTFPVQSLLKSKGQYSHEVPSELYICLNVVLWKVLDSSSYSGQLWMLLEEHSIGTVLTQFITSFLTGNEFEPLWYNKPY